MYIRLYFSNFYCMFLNPKIFFQFEINCSELLDTKNLQYKLKKRSVTKNTSDHSLFLKSISRSLEYN
jgi:hypothetical protein